MDWLSSDGPEFDITVEEQAGVNDHHYDAVELYYTDHDVLRGGAWYGFRLGH